MWNIIDIICFSIIAYGIVSGFISGFIKQIFSLGGLILAIIGARYLSPVFEKLFQTLFHAPDYLYAPLAYLAVFLLILTGSRVVALMLQKLIHWTQLGGIDRLSGMLFGGLKFTLLVSVLLVMIDAIDRNSVVIPRKYKEQSVLYVPLKKVAPALFPFIWKDGYFRSIKKEQDQNNKIMVFV